MEAFINAFCTFKNFRSEFKVDVGFDFKHFCLKFN